MELPELIEREEGRRIENIKILVLALGAQGWPINDT